MSEIAAVGLDGQPAGFGRGHGMTLKEMHQRIRDCMARRGMVSRKWINLEQKLKARQAEVRRVVASRARKKRLKL